MLRNVTTAFAAAVRALFTNWRTLALFVVVYAVLLTALYFFFTTPLARVWQVGLNFALALLAPALFFALQAMAVSYAQEGGARLIAAAQQFWKLTIVSVPVIIVAWLFGLLIGSVRDRLTEHQEKLGVALYGLWCVVLYVALPLIAAHVWIAAVRAGLGPAFKGYGRSIVRALSPRSLLTYAVGMIFFVAIPYALIVLRTPAKNPWVDMTLLGLRLALALLFMLVGWVITLGALSRLKSKAEAATASALPAPPTPALNQS